MFIIIIIIIIIHILFVCFACFSFVVFSCSLSTQIVDSENLAKCFMSTLLPKHIGEMKNFLGAYLE